MATDVETVVQGLECCLCFHLLEEPKLLSCTHSFCEKCLQHLHNSQGNGIELSCPLCRQITPIGNKEVSSLKTNVPLKSMVGDVKTGRKLCTLCDLETNSQAAAVYYCLECDEYVCDACLKGHGRYKKNANHMVVSVDDIKSGKVKVKQMCPKHPGEEKLWVCTSCKVSICFRCRMLDHNGSDHLVQEVAHFKKNTKEETEILKKRGMEKIEGIRSYTKMAREQTTKVEDIFAEREADINKVFDETLLQLNTEKNALLTQCKEQKEKLIDTLCNQVKEGEEMITSLSSACELVSNGVQVLLEGEALEVHSSICRELRDMLDRFDPDESKPKQVTIQAECFAFSRCWLENEPYLGMLDTHDWELKKIAECPTSGNPRSMAPTKCGKMLVGYDDYGGIEEFTVSGSKKVVLKTYLMGLSVLSNGHVAVYYLDDRISLYSSQWTKIDEKYLEVRACYDNGGMDVDKSNNHYVAYYDDDMIRVFAPESGALIREISCYVCHNYPFLSRTYTPFLICTMNHSNLLVVSDEFFVRMIDQKGSIKYSVGHKDRYYRPGARPAVLHDDSILIGWERDGHVTIDLYTNQLRHVKTVISGLDCRDCITDFWWGLREFSSGEIALCTPSKFYVLGKFKLRMPKEQC